MKDLLDAKETSKPSNCLQKKGCFKTTILARALQVEQFTQLCCVWLPLPSLQQCYISKNLYSLLLTPNSCALLQVHRSLDIEWVV